VDEVIPNCRVYKDQSTCGECKGITILEDGRCLPAQILDCFIYADASTCYRCNKDRYPAENGRVCLEVAEPIANCRFHGADQKCEVCERTFSLDTETATCITLAFLNCFNF